MPLKKNNHFKPALDFTNRTSALLITKLHSQKKALLIVRRALPKNLGQHVSTCVIKHNKLIVFCESSAWASQLRFYHPLIRSTISNQLDDRIDAIQIKIFIAPENIKSAVQKRSLKLPQQQTLAHIHQDAESIKHEPLKRALNRLEQTLRNKADKECP